MNSAEYRTLRVQILLIGALFAICIAAATVVATQREFVEARLTEKYEEKFDEGVIKVAAELALGQGTPKSVLDLNTESRLALYDHWMRAESAPAAAPRTMVAADPGLYLARAERSLICGDMQQKKKALSFFELAGDRLSVQTLEKARRWAERQRNPELSREIKSSIEKLRSLDEVKGTIKR